MSSLSTTQTDSRKLSDTVASFDRRPDRQEPIITSAEGVVTLFCKLDQIGSIDNPTAPLAQLFAKARETGSTKIVINAGGDGIESKLNNSPLAKRLGWLSANLKKAMPGAKPSIELANIPQDLAAEWTACGLHKVIPISAIRDSAKYDLPLAPLGAPKSFLPPLTSKPSASQVDICVDDGIITVAISKPRCTFTDLRPVERILEADKDSQLKIVFTHDCEVLANDAAIGIAFFVRNRSGKTKVIGCLSAAIKEALTHNDVPFSEDQPE